MFKIKPHNTWSYSTMSDKVINISKVAPASEARRRVETFFSNYFDVAILNPVLHCGIEICSGVAGKRADGRPIVTTSRLSYSKRFFLEIVGRILPNLEHLDNQTSLRVVAVSTSILALRFFVLPSTLISTVWWAKGGNLGDLKDSLEVALAFFVACTAIYWSLRSTYVSRWDYCATIFNKLTLELLPNTTSDADRVRNVFVLTLLATDLIELRMWSHSSFRAAFDQAIAIAVFYHQGKTADQVLEAVQFKAKNYISERMIEDTLVLDVDEVRSLLEELQSDLSDYLMLGYSKSHPALEKTAVA